MNLNATKEEFLNLSYKRPEGPFDGFVIIPTGEMHDSGYMCMKFALTYYDQVVGCVGGGSDVIDLNGIGGYGKDYNKTPQRQDWSIDCLENGLLRVFSGSHKLELPEYVLSIFEVYIGGKK